MDNRPLKKEQPKKRSQKCFANKKAVQIAVTAVHFGTSKTAMGVIIGVCVAFVKKYF